MKQCVVLLATAGLLAGCTHNRTAMSTDHRSADHQYARTQTQYTDGASAQTRASANLQGSTDERSANFYAQGNAQQAETGEGRLIEIPLYREELRVGKREVSKGGVVLRKVVETQRASQPVELRREEVVIERLSPEQAQARGAGDMQPFSEQEMVIELSREIPNVEKRAFVTEVIRARKSVDTRQQTIADTVRRENIDVNRQTLQANANNWQADQDVGAAAAAESGRNQAAQRSQSDKAELTLHEEQMNVSKRSVPSGRVVLRKTVETERVSRPVELRTEDVQIERDTIRREAGDTLNTAFGEREVFIPLFEEIPVIQKDVRVAEVVRARTNVETDQETVGTQLRRERLEVVRSDANQRNEAQGGQSVTEQGQNAEFEQRGQQRERNQPIDQRNQGNQRNQIEDRDQTIQNQQN